jgi:Xaa-Pro aminopeptidase
VLGTDGRYITQSAQQAPDLERLIDRQTVSAVAKRAAAARHRKVAYETHDVTVDGQASLARILDGAELVSLAAAVEQLRAIKDADEIELLRRACHIADRALADLLAADGIRAGRTELQIARDLDARMLGLGADAVSFETIVASGPNSAIPHHRPTGRTVERGDFVKLDFGAAYRGYHSDMTRTMVLGAPADWQREIYDVVADAQRLGREALQVGAETKAIDSASRQRIADAGYADRFTHGLGHGVGLEIHEAPSLAQSATGTLAADMPVTVEPGIYLEGRGGVRIEDTLVVRENGPELLTQTTKDLVIL